VRLLTRAPWHSTWPQQPLHSVPPGLLEGSYNNLIFYSSDI
jgi:hypothetical protein